MAWRLRWAARAVRDAERLDRRTRERILAALDRLATTEQGDVTRLRGIDAQWRLRVGDWRVRFRFEYDAHNIYVLRVLPRGRAYRE